MSSLTLVLNIADKISSIKTFRRNISIISRFSFIEKSRFCVLVIDKILTIKALSFWIIYSMKIWFNWRYLMGGRKNIVLAAKLTGNIRTCILATDNTFHRDNVDLKVASRWYCAKGLLIWIWLACVIPWDHLKIMIRLMGMSDYYYCF